MRRWCHASVNSAMIEIMGKDNPIFTRPGDYDVACPELVESKKWRLQGRHFQFPAIIVDQFGYHCYQSDRLLFCFHHGILLYSDRPPCFYKAW